MVDASKPSSIDESLHSPSSSANRHGSNKGSLTRGIYWKSLQNQLWRRRRNSLQTCRTLDALWTHPGRQRAAASQHSAHKLCCLFVVRLSGSIWLWLGGSSSGARIIKARFQARAERRIKIRQYLHWAALFTIFDENWLFFISLGLNWWKFKHLFPLLVGRIDWKRKTLGDIAKVRLAFLGQVSFSF